MAGALSLLLAFHPGRVAVSDGSLSVTNTFTVTVNSVNDPPTLDTIANLTINEDAPSKLRLGGKT